MRRYLARPLAAGTLALVLLTGTTAGAQSLSELSLEDLMRLDAGRVFGASERSQPVTEAPASVSFITAEDIARYGYRSLADILHGVRGLYVSDDRNFSFARRARVRQAGGLQQPDPPAGERSSRQRQRLRPGGDRRRVRPRPGDLRARRDHPWPGLVALRRQRVLRGRERHHADGAAIDGASVTLRGRLARHAAGARHGRRSPAQRSRLRRLEHCRAERRRRAALLPRVRYAGDEQRCRRRARRPAFRAVLRPCRASATSRSPAPTAAGARTCRPRRSARCSTSRSSASRPSIATRWSTSEYTRPVGASRVTLRGAYDRFTSNGYYPYAGRALRPASRSSASTTWSARGGPSAAASRDRCPAGADRRRRVHRQRPAEPDVRLRGTAAHRLDERVVVTARPVRAGRDQARQPC